MSSIVPILSFMVVYPLLLAGDGCVLIAIALVATAGGNPWVCGASFAFFHALYGILGIALTSQLAQYSETLGEAIVLLGSLILIKHFVHHRLHHGAHGDCSCEHHHPKPLGTLQIISTAAALSIHSLAAGAIIQQMTSIDDSLTVAAILLGGSLFLGLLVSLVVIVGESRRALILRTLDSLPGVVTATLTGICCYALHHLIEHSLQLPELFSWLYVAFSIVASISVGVWMHSRVGVQLVQLPTKIGRR